MSVKREVEKPGTFGRPAIYSPWSAGFAISPEAKLVFTPGVTARDEEGNALHPGDAVAQARRIFEQIDSILKMEGGSLKDVFKMTVYLNDIEDAAPIQEIRNEIWPDSSPVSSTIQVHLAGGQLVEIEAVAALEPDAG